MHPFTSLKAGIVVECSEEHVACRARQTMEEIVDALRSERQETLAFIAGLPHDVWDRIGVKATCLKE